MHTFNLYELIVLGVLALLGIVALLTVCLIALHCAQVLRENRERRRTPVVLPLVCRIIGDDEDRAELVASLRPSDRSIVRGALLQLALDLCGEESQRIASLAGELGLAHQERQRLGSWRTTVRAEAAKNLGLLRVREALPALLHALKFDPQPSVRLAAVWALGEIGGRKSVLGLLAMLEDLDLGVVRRAQEILLDSARDAASEIVDFVRRSEVPAARRAAVDVLRGLADPRATDLLVELADDPDVELRIKAVKAAAALADPRCAELFRRGLSDARWEVRCQAARGLGALGNRDAVGLLWEALADPVWWVRFNAASALEELGSAGDAALERAARDAHRQRREVARYVLERSSCGERAA